MFRLSYNLITQRYANFNFGKKFATIILKILTLVQLYGYFIIFLHVFVNLARFEMMFIPANPLDRETFLLSARLTF